MRFLCSITLTLLFTLVPATVQAQRGRKNEEDFVKEKPAVGDMLPDLVVYSPDGKEVKTADLRGHYTVLTFGCLT